MRFRHLHLAFAVFAIWAAVLPAVHAAPDELLALGEVEAKGLQVKVEGVRRSAAGDLPFTALREGESVTIRFRISETATGAPVRGARPVAWLSRLGQDEQVEPQKTVEKLQAFLGGGILGRPDADLNTYYVLVLNTDATVSVIDPLVGFSGSKLLATVSLPGPGTDWALAAPLNRLFVTVPSQQAVSVVDTLSWTPVGSIATGRNPSRVALQPDGYYLWIANEGSGTEAADAGVTVVSADDHKVRAHLPTGRGPGEIAFTEDSRFAFVLNRTSGTLSVIDVPALRKLHDIPVGSAPAALAYCRLARTAYVADADSGIVRVISPGKAEPVAEVRTTPGAVRLGFPEGGRFGLLLNERENRVQVIDSASNRVVQSAVVEKAPYALSFSEAYAYIRHRGVPKVLLVPLSALASDGRPLALAAFDGGQTAPVGASPPGSAADTAPAPEGGAMMLAHAGDKAVYYYQEGMAAPKGQFSAYGHEPRALLSLDRSLSERTEPGVYETTLRLGAPGRYELVFLSRSPRLLKGFTVEVAPNPNLEQARLANALVVKAASTPRVVKAGQPVTIEYAISHAASRKPAEKVQGLGLLAFLAPGVWQKRVVPVESDGGVYRAEFKPPRSGHYYLTLFRAGEVLPLEGVSQVIIEAVAE